MQLIIYSIFLLASFCCAAPNLDSLIANAPGLDKYPQASMITLLSERVITLDKDGFDHTRHEMLIKILDERAKDDVGDQSIPYSSDQDTVIIETAKTRLPSGEWIEPEKDAYTITSAPEVQWASAYSQLKQQNISFPGLDVGAAIYLVYRVEPKSKKEKPKDLRSGGITLFGGYNPLQHKSYTIEVEKGRSIKYEIQNSKAEPKINKLGNKTVYRWEFANQDQILQEPNSVGLSDLVPRLVWTTLDNWEQLGDYVTSRFWAKVDSSQSAVEGYFKITAAQLQGKPALMELCMWVAKNIRNVGLPLGKVGYEPNTADKVWQNKYGDTRDKAVLLVALIRAYGFAALPVLVPNSNALFSDLPVLEQFSHIIIAIPTGDDTMWVNPFSEDLLPGTLPYSNSLGKGCLLSDGAPMLIKVPPGPVDKARSAETVVRVELNKNGDISGTAVCTPHGNYEGFARSIFKDQKQQEKEIYFQRVAARIAQGTQVNRSEYSDAKNLTEPFVVSLGFESAKYAVKQDDLMLFELLPNPFSFGLTSFYPSLPEVKYPVAMPMRARTSTTFEITVPDEYSVSYLPPPLFIDNPFVYLELKAEQYSKKIIWKATTEIKADKVPLESYQTLREAYQNYALQKNRLMILESKKKSRS